MYVDNLKVFIKIKNMDKGLHMMMEDLDKLPNKK
jgi:hypothetical protein